MFTVKTNKEIGSYLKSLITHQYNSVRQFCIAYLKIDNRDFEDSDEIRNLANRFSQILNGNKSVQTYDLPIISELLSVSCEDILSCGDTKVPLSNRRTNYSIAFSNNKDDWEDYLSREDHIAAYADEYGKTILDYAIEFKNYDLIRYLIDKKYILLVSDDPNLFPFPNFGAESTISERPYDHLTLNDTLRENKLLRSKIISLAILNNDIDVLDNFKARVFPPQFEMNHYFNDFDLTEYYDKVFIKDISESQNNVFDYFLKEYTTKTYGGRYDVVWLFPFIGELVDTCIKNKKYNRALKAMNVIAEHNKTIYEKLHKTYLLAAKTMKDLRFSISFQDALSGIKNDYRINRYKDYVSFHPYYLKDFEPISSNIIRLNCSCKDESVQEKIDEVNNLYDRILNLPNSLIKNAQ